MCLVAVLAVSAVSWLLGRQHALSHLAFVDVTATAAARAMQEDHFYADYGYKILIIHGTVASARPSGNGLELSLRTDAAYGLSCTVAAPAGGPLLTGEAVSVVAAGGTARRQQSSVDLPDCRIMSDR